MTLEIASGRHGLHLPDDAVTQTFAILAMRGRGKTYTGSVMVEEMYGRNLPFVVIDPVGVWWGLRSTVTGKGEGLSVVIFGGDHADLPLEPTAGRLIADAIVNHHVPAVLDLSGFDSKADEIRFMTDFLTRLYRTNRSPLHVMVDEADEFAPQQAFPEGKRLLGAMEQVVRRGRARGLGCTLISQRPAVLNKNVLSQAETLILLGMTGVNDLAAVDAWVGKHADSEEARTIKSTLPGLQPGEAWVWSPSWLGVTQRIRVRKRCTFDSSATPKPGQQTERVSAMAPVDLDALGEQIAATREKAAAEDPAALQRQVADLRREVARLTAAAEAHECVAERVEVPVLDEAWRTEYRETVLRLSDLLTEGHRLMRAVPEPGHAGAVAPARSPSGRPSRPVPTESRPSPRLAAGTGPGSLPKAQRAILTVLAQHGTRDTTQTAILAGYTAGGGGFRNALGALRSAGYIEGRGDLTITAEGLAALGTWEPLPTGRALADHHAARLTKAAREALDVLMDAYPSALTAEEIAARTPTGYEASGGGFRNGLGRLRSLELVVTSGGRTRAADVLAEAG